MRIGICDDNQEYLNCLNQSIQFITNSTNNISIETLTPENLANSIDKNSIPYDILLSDIDMGTITESILQAKSTR
ncbi:MAG: hypothetical protein H6Q59_3522 [Firmicutes bacterium]|nr:hypothetical protein [Bacillota bacterium]